MPKLLATLGTSSRGVVETFIYLTEVKGEDITDIRIITTKNRQTELAYRLLVSALVCCTKRGSTIAVSKEEIEGEDVTNHRELEELVSIVDRNLSPGDYVDITGGRKIMSTVTALTATKKGANIITTIISQQHLNRVQQLMNSGREKTVEKPSDCQISGDQVSPCELVLREGSVTLEMGPEFFKTLLGR